jgi:ApbE superfamily uncharacterized protein (UPF0280 family)
VDHRSQLENGGSFQLANCKRLPVGLIIGSLKPRKFTAETVAPSGYGAICIIKKTSVYIYNNNDNNNNKNNKNDNNNIHIIIIYIYNVYIMYIK